jgi:hypothetical protein
MINHSYARHGGNQREKDVLRTACCRLVGLVCSSNQPNQTDQTNEIDQIYRPWRGRSMFLNTYSATRRPCAMPSVLSKAQWMPR